jgi:diguanylate cyclase (GGDEF)-like protein
VDKHQFYSGIYPWAVVIVAVAVLVVLGLTGQFHWSYALTFLFVACTFSEWLVIKLPQGNSLTLSIIFVLLALVFGADQASSLRQTVGALQVIVAGSLVGYGLTHRQPLLRLMFYVAHYVWAASLAGLTFVLVSQNVPSLFISSLHLPAVASYTVVFSLVSGLMIDRLNAHILQGERLPKADLLYTIFLAPIALIVYYFTRSRDLSITSWLLLAIPLIGVLATFRLYINIDTTYGEVSQLYEISREFVAAMSQDQIVHKVGLSIAQAVSQLIPRLDAALVYAHNDEANEYLLVNEASDSRAPRVILPGHGPLGELAVEGTGTIVNDVALYAGPASEEKGPNDHQWPPKTAILAYPMFAERAQVGLLVMVRHKKRFTTQELRLVGIVANQAGITLHNAKMYERSLQLATNDRMLGVLNQAAFTQRSQGILSHAGIANQQVAMLYPDIDDFRLVNNTYGHSTGDRVLIGIADIMKAVVNTSGIVGRSGGEEFFILLPDTDDERAIEIADEIRQRVQDKVFTSDDQRELWVTLSIGVAVFPRDAGDFAGLKKQADRAAYLAKRMGKNQVCLYQDRKELIEPVVQQQEPTQVGSHTQAQG